VSQFRPQFDPRQQLANTPLPQSTTPGLHTVSIHQMAPSERTSGCSLRSLYFVDLSAHVKYADSSSFSFISDARSVVKTHIKQKTADMK